MLIRVDCVDYRLSIGMSILLFREVHSDVVVVVRLVSAHSEAGVNESICFFARSLPNVLGHAVSGSLSEYPN